MSSPSFYNVTLSAKNATFSASLVKRSVFLCLVLLLFARRPSHGSASVPGVVVVRCHSFTRILISQIKQSVSDQKWRKCFSFLVSGEKREREKNLLVSPASLNVCCDSAVFKRKLWACLQGFHRTVTCYSVNSHLFYLSGGDSPPLPFSSFACGPF